MKGGGLYYAITLVVKAYETCVDRQGDIKSDEIHMPSPRLSTESGSLTTPHVFARPGSSRVADLQQRRPQTKEETMRLTLMMFFPILLCGFLSVACPQLNSPSSKYPVPPATSYRIESMNLSLADSTDTDSKIRVAYITPQFIQVVGVLPALGRNFLVEEYRPEKSSKVVVLSYELWQQRFGGDPEVIGRIVKLQQQKYTVVGILPKSFNVPEGVALWLPEEIADR